MNRMPLMFYVSSMLMILLAACSPAGSPTATAAPVNVGSATKAPLATSTTAPLDLAGPPMQVGSTYLYFDGTLLVAVPGGSFLMGHGGSDNPEHTVTLSDYWIYSTKVTNLQFQQCVAVGKCTPPDEQVDRGYTDPAQQSNPVVGVKWAQGEAYCEYVNGSLPTEAQWEKAARGPNGNLYPWGDNQPGPSLLNYNNNVGETTNVVTYPKGKSFYDALDMEGNVYEWVYDWYDPLYYKGSPVQDPQGPDKGVGGQRSVRSAGFKSNDDQVVSSTRSYYLPGDVRRDLGFRCVVKDPTFFAPLCELNSFIGNNLGGGGSSSNGPACTPPTFTVNGPDCQQPAGVVTVDAGTGDMNFSPSASSGCTQDPNPGNHTAKYDCTKAGSVTVTYTCGASSPGNPTCPAHYTLKNGKCSWDGSGTAGQACPAGTQYNATQMCCMSTAGTGTDFCPSGMVKQDLGNGQFTCEQPGAQGSQQSASVSVGNPPTAAQCSNGGGSCNKTCISPYVLNPATCTCHVP